MDIPEECVTVTHNRLIPLEENNRKLTFVNNLKQKIEKIKIDNCVITNGRCCDWLVIDTKNTEYFVELKGADVKHAVKQLIATIQQVSQDKYKQEKVCIIISSRSPLNSAEIQCIKSRFKRDYHSKFFLKNIRMEYEIEA